MLQVRMEKVRSTVVKMIQVCDDRIYDLKDELNEAGRSFDEYTLKDYEERIKHYESLIDEAKESVKLIDEI